MARRLTSGPACGALALLGFLTWPGVAAAQATDPTEPPQPLVVPGTTPGNPPVASGLQSVIMRHNGRPAALINGQIVELGGRVGEARLVKVEDDAVILRGPQGDETLRLMPSVEKKMIVEKKAKSSLNTSAGHKQSAKEDAMKEKGQ